MTDKRLQGLRDVYRPGVRVELVRMDDPQAPPPGTRGTVRGVDAVGSILVDWDNGSGLNVAYPEDRCRILVGEWSPKVREQILAIRASGETNMFDIPAVQAIANREGYHELVLYLVDHKREYAGFILHGDR